MKCKIVASVLYDYDARTTEELSIKEGDVLLIIDDSDPEWWTALERKNDAFSDAHKGLVPADPIISTIALYDYDARTEEEISFLEGARVLIYENSDPEWWFARIDNEAGLVPSNYVEQNATAKQPQFKTTPAYEIATIPIDSGTPVAATDQKNLLLNTLDMFGPASKSQKVEKEKPPIEMKLFSVFVVDKKKKKEKKEFMIGVSSDYVIYLCEDIFNNVIEKWKFSELTNFSEKKGKKVILQFGSDVREFEGEKDNLDGFFKRLEEVKALSKVSGPILTGPPPNMGPPEGSFQGIQKTSMAPAHSTLFSSVSSPVQNSNISLKTNQATLIALYDYDAATDEELSIRENDEMILLDGSDVDWWRVKLIANGSEGLVPATYVEPKTNSVVPPPRPNIEINLPQRIPDVPKFEPVRFSSESRSQAESPLRSSSIKQPEIKPVLGARPNIIASSFKQPELNKKTEPISDNYSAIPSSVPRLPGFFSNYVANRPVIPDSRPITNTAPSPVTEFPDSSRIRTWTDRTGTFKVDAEFLHISDSKAFLHKTNGVRISVPLEKLSPVDIEYIRSQPGYHSLLVPGAVGVPTPGASRSRPTAPEINLDNIVYNGFNWREWLLKAGISSTDATTYATKFVIEKMDKTILDGIDREVLKVLGVSEGDIIRIRKQASLEYPGRKLDAEKSYEFHMKSLQSLKLATENNDQVDSDEKLARQLQELELNGASGHTSSLLKGNRARPSSTFNPKGLAAATQLLSSSNSQKTSTNQASRAASRPQSSSSKSFGSDPWGDSSNVSSVPSENRVTTSFNSSTASSAAPATDQFFPQQVAAAQLLNQRQQLLVAQQQQALNAQQQAERAAQLLQQQKAIAEQQTALAARRASELEAQKRQLEFARVEAEKAAQLKVIKDETARLEAQLAEQKRLAALRPMQPALIPTPSGPPSNLAFVTVSGQILTPAGPPSMPNQPNPGMMPHQFNQGGFQGGFMAPGIMQSGYAPGFQAPQNNSNDKYAALKDLDPLSSGSSIFSSSQPMPANNYGNSGMTMPSGMQGMARPSQAGMMGVGGNNFMMNNNPNAGFGMSNMPTQNQFANTSLTPEQMMYLQQQQRNNQFAR